MMQSSSLERDAYPIRICNPYASFGVGPYNSIPDPHPQIDVSQLIPKPCKPLEIEEDAIMKAVTEVKRPKMDLTLFKNLPSRMTEQVVSKRLTNSDMSHRRSAKTYAGTVFQNKRDVLPTCSVADPLGLLDAPAHPTDQFPDHYNEEGKLVKREKDWRNGDYHDILLDKIVKLYPNWDTAMRTQSSALNQLIKAYQQQKQETEKKQEKKQKRDKHGRKKKTWHMKAPTDDTKTKKDLVFDSVKVKRELNEVYSNKFDELIAMIDMLVPIASEQYLVMMQISRMAIDKDVEDEKEREERLKEKNKQNANFCLLMTSCTQFMDYNFNQIRDYIDNSWSWPSDKDAPDYSQAFHSQYIRCFYEMYATISILREFLDDASLGLRCNELEEMLVQFLSVIVTDVK